MINKFYGLFKENNDVKYLTITDNNEVLKKYEEVFSRLKYHFNKIYCSNVIYEKDYNKIKFNTDDPGNLSDSILLNKVLYFPTITVVIRCVFKQNGLFYSQVYLDDCLYQI